AVVVVAAGLGVVDEPDRGQPVAGCGADLRRVGPVDEPAASLGDGPRRAPAARSRIEPRKAQAVRVPAGRFDPGGVDRSVRRGGELRRDGAGPGGRGQGLRRHHGRVVAPQDGREQEEQDRKRTDGHEAVGRNPAVCQPGWQLGYWLWVIRYWEKRAYSEEG